MRSVVHELGRVRVEEDHPPAELLHFETFCELRGLPGVGLTDAGFWWAENLPRSGWRRVYDLGGEWAEALEPWRAKWPAEYGIAFDVWVRHVTAHLPIDPAEVAAELVELGGARHVVAPGGVEFHRK
jgi:hypothetical protein